MKTINGMRNRLSGMIDKGCSAGILIIFWPQYKEEKRKHEELGKELGLFYVIFGSTYVSYVSYHVYKLRLLKRSKCEGSFASVL